MKFILSLLLMFGLTAHAFSQDYTNVLDAPAAEKKPEYTWTPDHIQVGVRWQPSGRRAQTDFEATLPVISTDSSYVQFWINWAAIEPNESNSNYQTDASTHLLRISQAVDHCNDLGLKVEFVIMHVPQWAAEQGIAGGYKPKQGLYQGFVERLAEYFKGRVHAWQLAHEFNLENLMRGADLDFRINKILLGGAQVVQQVYKTEPAMPVIISTTGCSPCETCGTCEGLDGTGAAAISQFYDKLIANKRLMSTVDALNMNASDFGNGYGNMDGSYITAVWDNFDMLRSKLDAAGFESKKILAAESWVTWDGGANAFDVDGNGIKNETDAYFKTTAILGACLQRGMNSCNLPWADNSSGWAMGLTKRRDYNGRMKTLHPDSVIDAEDGGPGIVTRKVSIHGDDDNFTVHDGAGENFSADDYINPSDPNHLHYYIWRWYAQIAGGRDEVIRHAVAGEIDNDIKVTGIAYTGVQQYRISSYNRSKDRFTVLIYSSAANNYWAKLEIPATIQTGRHFNNDDSWKDYRGEGFRDGETYYARIVSHDISNETGENLRTKIVVRPDAVVEDGVLKTVIPQMDKFTLVEFIKREQSE